MLVAAAAIALLSSANSGLPTMNGSSATTPNQIAPKDDQSDHICITVRRVRERIAIGRGVKKMDITLGGGVCESPLLGISDLALDYATRDGMGDAVEAADCLAYRDQITKLFLSPQHRSRPIGEVRVGPFQIAGLSKFFDLQSASGRKWAARWIRETLVAVQPCWNNFRQDQTQYVVGDLYSTLGVRPR
jgi:hypothetical protein